MNLTGRWVVYDSETAEPLYDHSDLQVVIDEAERICLLDQRRLSIIQFGTDAPRRTVLPPTAATVIA